MPGDKISGQNKFDGTFLNIVTPFISPVRAMSYNFFLPYRAVDNTFYKGMVPTKLNQMSANWSTPLFNTRAIIDKLVNSYLLYFDPYISEFYGAPVQPILSFLAKASVSQVSFKEFIATHEVIQNDERYINAFLYGGTVLDNNGDEKDGFVGLIPWIIKNLTDPTSGSTSLYHQAEAMYMCDALLDIVDHINYNLGTADAPISHSLQMSHFMYLFWKTLFEPFVGRYSYYAQFKYPYVRPLDLMKIRDGLVSVENVTSWSDFLSLFSNEDKNEYAIRIMYAIWYDRFRNVDLEPVSNTLPDFRDFGTTSVVTGASGNLCFLLYRIRSWEKDMFTTAQVDDISRHVYAPIISGSDSIASYHTEDHNNLDTQSLGEPSGDSPAATKPALYNLSYRDQLSGTNLSVSCPVPTNINDMLSSLDISSTDVYGLDLNTLRQSQQLERYLKRNYLFGDEYKDRLLAHYNSRLSDMRINRPELLSQSINDYKMAQQIANEDNGIANAGDRVATAEITLGGDQFTTYCEEFGMVVTLLTFMPSPMYDGDDAHNSLTKQVHFPLPEFATNNEEFGRKSEISGSALNPTLEGDDADCRFIFGRYPVYHIWRSRVDEVGGLFLDEMQDCTFRRFWGNYSKETTLN